MRFSDIAENISHHVIAPGPIRGGYFHLSYNKINYITFKSIFVSVGSSETVEKY